MKPTICSERLNPFTGNTRRGTSGSFVRASASAFAIAMAALIGAMPLAAGDSTEYQVPVTLSVLSAGFSGGGVLLYRDRAPELILGGGAGGGRGWVAIQINPVTQQVIEARNFDTWADTFIGTGGGAHFALVDYLQTIPAGVMVLLAAGDEAGLNFWPPRACERLIAPGVEDLLDALHKLGSSKVDEYCYNGALAMRWIQGNPEPPTEVLMNAGWGEDGSWQIRPSVLLTTTFYRTVGRPSLRIKAEYVADWDCVRYHLTATGLIENRDTEIQMSTDLKEWGHLMTVNSPGTNQVVISNLDLPGQVKRYFRLVPDDQTVLLP